MSFNIHDNKRKVILLFLFAVGTILRFYRFDEAIGWWGDAARDYLVAYHLAKFNEPLIIGHFATGVSGGFYHPPYYYYLLSLFVRIYESPFFVTGIFTLLHSLSIITMYEIGKALYGTRTGLLSAALFAVSSKMVTTSRALTPANATLPIVMLSILFLIRGIKKSNNGYVYLAFALLLIASSFWYGTLLLFFYVLIITFWKFHSQYRFLVTLSICLLVGLVIIELPLVVFFGVGRVISIFLPQNNIHFKLSIFKSTGDIIGSYFLTIFNQNYHFALTGMVVLVLLVLFLMWKSKKSLFALLMPLSAIIFVALLCSLKSGEFFVHYITSYEPAAYLVFGYLLISAVHVARGSRLSQIFSVICFGVLMLSISNNFLYIKYIPSDYKEAHEILSLILPYVKKSSFQIVTSVPDTPSGWESPAIWYFLEKNMQVQRVHAVNYGENLESIDQEYVYQIFVCKNFESPQEDYICYEKLHQRYAQYAVIRTITYQKNNKYAVYITKLSL